VENFSKDLLGGSGYLYHGDRGDRGVSKMKGRR
jgi:hypothetical protein